MYRYFILPKKYNKGYNTLESAYVILLFIWICAALHITLSNIGESSEMYYYYLRIMAQV